MAVTRVVEREPWYLWDYEHAAHAVAISPLGVDGELRADRYRVDCHTCPWPGGVYRTYGEARTARYTHAVRERGRDGWLRPLRPCADVDLSTLPLIKEDLTGWVVYCDNCGRRAECCSVVTVGHYLLEPTE